MLKVIDKVLTRVIDWLYLKRTTVRLKMLAKESASADVYPAPQPETVDYTLNQYGLTRDELAVTNRGRNITAALKY